MKSVGLTGGVDFNTTSLTATFDNMTTMSNISIPVTTDKIVEEDETFDVSLSIPSSVNSRIKVQNSRKRATVTITDSSSECVKYV